jgi:predicted RNase H-like HicB family nuclease
MKTKDTYYYPAILNHEDGKEISVVFPDLDVATSGIDDADALNSARECLGITLWGLEEDGEEFPTPTALSDIEVADNEQVLLVDVFMPAIRMANENKSVNRTVTLSAKLNALALEKGLNFSQVLQEGLMEKLGLTGT